MKPGIYDTRDIALAAFIAMKGESKGVKVLKVEREGAQSRFFFKNSNGIIDKLILDFPTSESFRFDAKMRALKSMGYVRGKG